MECVVPLQPSRATTSVSAEEPTNEQMSRWRALLLPSTLPTTASEEDFSIPSSVSEHIQTRFVAQRQAAIIPGATPPVSDAGKSASGAQAGSVTQEDLVLRLGVARLLCASEDKKELDVKMWERTEQLDEERKARLAAY